VETAFALQPGRVLEWEQQDESTAMLGRVSTDPVDLAQARSFLDGVTFSLPAGISTRDLVAFSAVRGTPLGEALVPDLARYDYTLVEVPLNILLPPSHVLSRLRLAVALEANSLPDDADPVVAYDLFPSDRWREVLHDHGNVGVDVTKLLTFVCPAPLGEVLDLRLAFPIRWKTQVLDVRSSDRMSNPVEWYVSDAMIADGFCGYVIVRSPKGVEVTAKASLAAELRSRGPLGIRWGRFSATDDRSYPVTAARVPPLPVIG
jgi:hypothetical protein